MTVTDLETVPAPGSRPAPPPPPPPPSMRRRVIGPVAVMPSVTERIFPNFFPAALATLVAFVRAFSTASENKASAAELSSSREKFGP